MITAFLTYAIVIFTGFALYRRRRWLELLVVCVPALFCGYFLLSIGIFSFGEEMPFTYYSRDRKEEYGYVSTMICLHFLTVTVGFLIAGRFDVRPYIARRSQHLKSIGLGVPGAFFCLMPVVFVVLSLPASELWYRNSFRYEVGASNWLRFADLLVLLSAILIPFIRSQILKYSILILVTIGFLALGSRTAVLVLFVFSLMNLIVVKKTRTWVSVAILVAAFWLLGVILLLRLHNLGGIFAVVEAALFGDYEAIIQRMIYGINYNFNLSFVLIADLLSNVRTEDRWFYYGVLPIPSAFFDQTDLYDATNRFRANIPYSGFGYALAHMGGVQYITFVLFSSLAFLIARKIFSVKRDIYEAILCFGVFVFPFIILLQYNLRTGTRIAYTFIAVYFVVAIWRSSVIRARGRRVGRGGV